MNKPSKFALALAFAAVTASGVASAQSYPCLLYTSDAADE